MDKNKTTLVLLAVGGILTLLIIVAGMRSQYGAIVSEPEEDSQVDETPLGAGPRR